MKQNIIVADEKFRSLFTKAKTLFLTPQEYITAKKTESIESANIYNLASSFSYQGIGYYVSLLAKAREHRVFPDATLIQDLKDQVMQNFYSEEMDLLVQGKLKQISSHNFELSVYFGMNLAEKYQKLCKHFHRIIQAPLFRVYFAKEGTGWFIQKIKLLTLDEISESHLEFLQQKAEQYFAQTHRYHAYKDKSLFDIAIWVNPEEESPPSNEKAINKFVKAGRDLNLFVDVISKKDQSSILEYDALFIRETTKVNHVTYRISRRAKSEGMVVIDDPDSIIKCTNKIYLEQMLDKLRINRPASAILHKKNFKEDFKNFPYPRILKQPDSAFSQGVFKANNEDEFKEKCSELFKTSDLILMQEFLKTDFDWRIGILNNEILFACKYYMAQNHWQIINNNSTSEKTKEGNDESVAIKDIPDNVAKTALKACKGIGNGLYGVDLKVAQDKVYVIEVNDNPNIDQGVEDALLGDKLYHKIMKHFLTECQWKRAKHG